MIGAALCSASRFLPAAAAEDDNEPRAMSSRMSAPCRVGGLAGRGAGHTLDSVGQAADEERLHLLPLRVVTKRRVGGGRLAIFGYLKRLAKQGGVT